VHADPYVEMRDLWADYNERQSYKHDLMNRKTTWMLTTEGLLFAAVGIDGVDAPLDEFEQVVAWSGLSVALAVLIGVVFLIGSKWTSHKQYRDIFSQGVLHGPPFRWGGVRTGFTLLTLTPDVVQPIVFIVAWAWLLRWT
jgi:hypothetical protein